MDVGQHVEHLVVVQHSGVQTQATLNLLGQDLKICSQKARWSRQRQWLIAPRWSLAERMELAVAIGDIGQAPKVEDLAQSKELSGKRTPLLGKHHLL